MAELIVITSGKGGVGKTTVAAFLGAKLAERGKKTVVCDLDFGLNNLDIVMGAEKKVVYDLSDALEGRCRANQALTACPNVKNLYLISSVRTVGKSISGQNIKQLFEGLKNNFDYVLFDCPAGLDTGFHRAVSASNSAIVVITPALSSIRDADKVLSVLRSYNMKKIGIVVNMARGDLMITREVLTINEIEELLKTKVIGVIPQDDSILISKNCYIDSSIPCGNAFYKLAKSIVSGRIKYADPTNKYTGFWGSIKRSLKRKL